MLSKWSRKTREPDNDIEMSEVNATRNQQQRDNLIQKLFNLDNHTVQSWPGIHLYITYIEAQIKLVEPARFEPLWRAMGHNLPPEVDDCLQIVALVATSCRQLPSRLSIDEILQTLLAAIQNPSESHDDDVELATTIQNPSESHDNDVELATTNRQAIFTVIAWLTMLVRPSSKLSEAGFNLIIEKKFESLQTSQPLDSSSYPVFSLLRGFGCMVPCESIERSKTRDPSLLYTSNLNLFYLKTVGKVNIRWTYSLDSHLEFEQNSRTLSLFCFPTFCALNILAERTGGSIFDQ